MKLATTKIVVGGLLLALLLAVGSQAQSDKNPVQGSSGQALQPAGIAGGVGNPSSGSAPAAPTTRPPVASITKGYGSSTSTAPGTKSQPGGASPDDNPFNPLLEPPPLPKGKPTLIGGLATHVDRVRDHLTIQPFGGGPKIKVFVDERSHIYRDGAETTVLGIHKGDRVYVDTMLDGSQIFAKNVRVVTQTGTAQMRGQVIGFNRETGTVSLRDQLSSRPIAFDVSSNTKFSSANGATITGDLQPGSLVQVQFAPNRNDRPSAQQIVVLANPGDSYVFSGEVVSLDMRTNSLSLENRSDEQTYELHFSSMALPDSRALKVGSEVTARAVFDGKEYKATNLQIENANQEQAQQPQVQ